MKDKTGKPTPNMELTLMPDCIPARYLQQIMNMFQSNERFRTVLTDKEGRFTLKGIPEGGYLLLRPEWQKISDFRRLTVKPGETTRVEFSLQDTMEVSILLRTSREELQSSARVMMLEMYTTDTAFPEYNMSLDLFHGLTVKKKLLNVHPGKHRLISTGFLSENGIARKVEIKPDTKQIRISGTFKPGKRTISGRMRNYSGLGIGAMSRVLAVGERHFATGDIFPDGSFLIKGLHPDRYRLYLITLDALCVNGAQYCVTQEVTVEKDKDVEGIVIP